MDPEDQQERAGGEGGRWYGEASDHGRVYQAGRDQYIAGQDVHLHFVDALRETRRTAARTVSDECPYPGLAAFAGEHAAWFFGRDGVVADLLGHLDEQVRSGGPLVVVAASGAGKSSLLGAGLLPAVARGALPVAGAAGWPRLFLTPGARPVAALARQLGEATGGDARRFVEAAGHGPQVCAQVLDEALGAGGGRLVVVVDQAEELFTACDDPRQRRDFLALLDGLTRPRPGGAGPVGLVVLGLRSDFYTACVDHPWLRAALQTRQVLLGPMAEAELREAIAFPAEAVGLRIESGLVELLLRDLGVPTAGAATGSGPQGERPVYEAGRLPLLAHALRATWQQRHGRTLTVAGYRTTGGIHRAVANTAERLFTGLPPPRQAIARTLFLRLVKIGDGTEDTCRQLPYALLHQVDADVPATAAVIEAFAHGRLLTRQQDALEITHEALLRAWPRLRGWIEGDRAALLVRQDVEQAATDWEGADRDPGLLYRGSRLESARAWALRHRPDPPSASAAAFLTASGHRERRAARRRRSAVALLAVLTLIASLAAVVAFEQRGQARDQRDAAVFNQVTATADQLRSTQASLAAHLGLAAHRMRPDDEGPATRLVDDANRPLSSRLNGHQGTIRSVVFSRDGRSLATAGGDGTVRLWNTTDPTRTAPLGKPLTGHNGTVTAVTFSPDGHTLATAGEDGTVRLWNTTNPSRPTSLGKPLTGHDGTVTAVTFSADGNTLATTGEDRTARLWNTTNPSRPTSLGTPFTAHGDIVTAAAFHPRSPILATAGKDRVVKLWDLSAPAGRSRSGQPRLLARPLAGHGHAVTSVVFSADGRTLATGSWDLTVRLWNVADPRRASGLGRAIDGHTSSVTSVAFSPDGLMLASAAEDRTIRLWSVADPRRPEPVGHPLTGHTRSVTSMAFSPDGHALVSGGSDRAVRVWTGHRRVLTGHRRVVRSVAFGADGRTLATASGDGTARLWNVADPARPRPLGPPLTGHDGTVWAVALSPDGRTLATGGKDRTVRLWNVTDPARPTPLGKPLVGHTDVVLSLAFSPDGDVLATAGEDGTARLWDVNEPARPRLLGAPLHGHDGAVWSVAFSPDGRTLATASEPKVVRLWDVADPGRASPIGRPLVGHVSAVFTVRFSPDGRTLASAGSDERVRLWHVADPKRPRPAGPPLTSHSGAVWAVAFSPDGDTLATAGNDQSVRLWNIADPDRPGSIGAPLTSHTSAVRALAFGPSGHTLATGGENGTALLWEMRTDRAAHHICTSTDGSLTREQWQQYVPGTRYRPPCR
ncbi:hypothetical protein [Streptomyces sp. NPDC048057]|uniref:nSTAND1 domain-containing NTPase n=1 Tax=Streptomyces sp. NPDC048057 TaxID=3155628 RepID=UPI0033DBFDA0